MERSIFAVGGVILLFLIGCIGFITLMAGSLFYEAPDLTVPANSFFVSAANDDLQSARSHLSAEYSENLSENLLDQFITDNQFELFQSAKWQYQSVDQSSGELHGTVIISSGQNIPLRVQLVETDEKWKIDNIEIVESQPAASDNSPKLTNAPAAHESQIPAEIDPVLNPSDISKPIPTQTVSLNTTENRSPNSGNPNPTVETSAAGTLNVNDIPGNVQAKEMARKWSQMFCDGIANNDLSELHSKLAEEFRQKFSLREFTYVFEDFRNRNKDFSWARNCQPILTREPSLNAQGVLNLEGYFPAETKVEFSYSFTKTDQGWEPVAINVQVPSEIGKLSLPPNADLKKQVRSTTRKFGLAIKNRDFSSFYRNTYSKFQEKFTIQQFRDYFGSFIQNEADLKWVQGIEPVFDNPPSIDANGFVKVEGHFPSEPLVNFRYAFIKEGGQWKVSTINLSIPSKEQVSLDGKDKNDAEETQ